MPNKILPIEQIRIDCGTQARAAVSEQTVAEYAEALTEGATFPPPVVFHDGSAYFLADGFHRLLANRRIGALSIECDVRIGALTDAQLWAYGANQSHGLRRSNEDKRRAVQGMLALVPDWSDRAIAKHVGVGHPLVAAIRSPEAAERQAESRKASERRKVESDSTPMAGSAPRPRAESDPAPRPEQLPSIGANDAERDDVLAELAEEVERLTDRLAVEAMDATEEEKTLAAETIAQLRAEVASLQAQLRAAHGVRDQLMAENAQLKRQCVSQQRQIKKLEGGK